jgi:hypothetical protein
MKNKFTFETVKPKGRWKSFEKSEYLIKLNGKECGYINPDNFQIVFACYKNNINSNKNSNCSWTWVRLKNKNSNCSWTWVRLKNKFSSLDEAKEWIIRSCDKIVETLSLYTFEEYRK